MKKKIGIIVIILLAGLAVFLIIPSNRYVAKALWYQLPDIDDYKIFDNNVIKADNPQVWKIADNYNSKNLSAGYLQYFEELKTVGYLVVKDTAIVFERYWDGYDEQSYSGSFSAAKSLVSLLAGIARDEGKIKSFDQSVADYYPPYSDSERKKITIKDVLTMSAGLDWNESYSSLFSVTTKSYYGTDLAGMINKLKVVEEPGKRYRYQSGVTQLLAFIVEGAVGKSISEYMSEKLWTPIGAEQEALWSLDKQGGMEKAYCCFNTNVRDFARVGQLILNKGCWDGKQIVSEEFITEATSPALWLKDGDTDDNVDFYGYQWWVLNYKGMEIKYARGILGQYVFVVPDKNMVVVRLGHKRSDSRKINKQNPDDIYMYIDAALSIID